MAPEQMRGDADERAKRRLCHRHLLHECCPGAAPFGGDTLNDVVRAVLEVEPPPIDGVPPAAQAVITRAAREARRRSVPSAASLAEAIVAAVPDAAGMLPRDLDTTRPFERDQRSPAVSHTTIGEPLPRSRRALVTWCAVAACVAAAVIPWASIAQRRRWANRSSAKRRRARRSASRSTATSSPGSRRSRPRSPRPRRRSRFTARTPAPPQPAPESEVAPPPPVAAPATTVVRDPGF